MVLQEVDVISYKTCRVEERKKSEYNGLASNKPKGIADCFFIDVSHHSKMTVTHNDE